MDIPFRSALPDAQRKSSVLPPWLWFWLVIYALGFSGTLDLIKKNFLIIVTGRDGTSSLVYGFLERVPSAVELLLDITLSIGVLSVLLPWTRTIFLEKKYRLFDPSVLPSETLPITLRTLEEVRAFIIENVSYAIVKYSIGGLHDYAFIYPIGYRRVGIAVSGRFLDIWRNDQQRAKAVLLHEIAHYQHGDTWIIGAGSLLEAIVRNWLRLYAIFFFFPLFLSIIIEHVVSFREDMAPIGSSHLIVGNLQSVISSQIQQIFTQDIPFMFIAFLNMFCWTGVLFTVVLIGIWCSELNADRFVMDTTNSSQAFIEATEQHVASTSWWRWLLDGISHPPKRIRQWFIFRSQRMSGLILLLLFFPVAWFIRLLFLLGWALSYYVISFLYMGASAGNVVGNLLLNTQYYLAGLVPSWLAMACLLLVWPLLARYWESFFGRVTDRLTHARYGAYLLSAGCVLCVCLVGFVVSLLPAVNPEAFGPASASSPASVSSAPSGHFKVGDAVKIGDMWLVTISHVQANPSNGLIAAKPGDVYLEIDVSLKNISGQANYLASSEQFILQDLHGTTYDETYVAAIPPPEVHTPGQDGNVPAGATVQGQLNYEVPASIQQFTLSFIADWKNYDPTTSKMTVWDISTGSSGTSTTSSATSSSAASYPILKQTYQGALVNTTDNLNVSANTVLSSVKQDGQGHISGYMQIQQPLVGSGSFVGTVSKNGAIQFVVTPDDKSAGYTAIDFVGVVHQDGSMDGTYTLPGTGQGGTWQFKPAQS